MENLNLIISGMISRIMKIMDYTQANLAERSGIAQSRLSKYISGKELPSLENLIKIVSVIGFTEDDFFNSFENKMLEKEMAKEKLEEFNISNNKGNIIAGNSVINGNIYNNTTVKELHPYNRQPDDITEAQAYELKSIVEEIVNLEKEFSQRPKSYAAVWNVFKKKFKVSTYRAIKENNYEEAKTYLAKWRGKLKRQDANDDAKRKTYYSNIYASLRNIKWTKEDLTNFIYDLYSESSLKDLSLDQLEQLARKIYYLKKKV